MQIGPSFQSGVHLVYTGRGSPRPYRGDAFRKGRAELIMTTNSPSTGIDVSSYVPLLARETPGEVSWPRDSGEILAVFQREGGLFFFRCLWKKHQNFFSLKRKLTHGGAQS